MQAIENSHLPFEHPMPSPRYSTAIYLRALAFLASTLAGFDVSAQDYMLKPASTCSAVGGGLNFKCSPERNDYVIYIYRSKKQWMLKHVWNNPPQETTIGLDLVRNDSDVLILNQPVLFSGSRLFHLIKPNQEYFMSEVAHASLGSEVSVTQGSFVRSDR